MAATRSSTALPAYECCANAALTLPLYRGRYEAERIWRSTAMSGEQWSGRLEHMQDGAILRFDDPEALLTYAGDDFSAATAQPFSSRYGHWAAGQAMALPEAVAYALDARREACYRLDEADTLCCSMRAYVTSCHISHRAPPSSLRVAPLTAEEKARLAQVMAQAKALQARMLQRRGGKRLSPSWKIIEEARQQRASEL
jgi:hypothetical protein